MSCGPKLSVAGVRDTEDSVPVPARAMVTAGEFDWIWMLADLSPFDVGSKRARTLHVSPGASVVLDEQSLPPPLSSSNWFASGPPSVTELSCSGSLPVFLTVDVSGALGP